MRIERRKAAWIVTKRKRKAGASSRNALLTLLIGVAACQEIRSESLDAIVQTISRKHPVAGIEARSLADSLSSVRADRFVLFDVRMPEEFAVSRLEGAIRVDPDMDASGFVARHGRGMRGKTAVFYCSVGYRSSVLAEKVIEATGDSTGIVNLRGGIFGWYNEGLTVHDSTGVTNQMHPYSDFWGRLLKSRDVAGEDESVPGSR